MIKKTKYLSQKEREIARKFYYRFVGWNGSGFSFLGNTTVYLLAILYGASNTQLGYISSAAFITGGILVVYPRIFRGRSIRTVGYVAWLIRGLVCLGYLILPLLKGQAAVFLILVIYSLFCLTRTIGVAVQQTIQKMISTSRTRGEVVMTSATRFNSIALISRFFSYIMTSFQYLSDLTEILILQILGVISNTFASRNLNRMPSREVIDYNPGRHVGKLFTENMKKKKERKILTVRWCAVGIEILAAMTIPFLRQFAGFSSSMIFLYTIVITVASISAALAIRPFADRLGSRPFILPAAVVTSGLFLIWMFADPSRSSEFFFILGFLTVMMQNILSLLASRLFIQTIPEEDSVSYTSMDVVITSALALFLGFTAGALADFSALAEIPRLNIYGLTFSLGLLLCGVIIITAAGFEEKGSSSLKDTWTMLLSVDHMRTFRDISRLNINTSSLKRKSLILSLGYAGSSLADEEIRQIFRHPLSSEKGEVMKTLFERKRPALVPDLLREASDPQSFHRQDAIFTLGAYPEERVEETLIRLLHDPDSITASNAAKSLGRIGHKESMNTVYERFTTGRRGLLPRDLNYAIALHHMDPGGRWMECLFSEINTELGETYEQSLLTLVARLMDLNPPLGWIFQKNNASHGEGITILLDEAREMELFFSRQSLLEKEFRQKQYRNIWEWCCSLTGDLVPAGTAVPILESMKTFDSSRADAANTIGVLFFTYQILKEGGSL